ncbi:hypothetical protein EMIT051CA3_40020 [Pseudomonas chlororaphis]
MVDQVLGDPVPSGVLDALGLQVLAAELGPQVVGEVHVEGDLADGRLGFDVVEVAFRVLLLEETIDTALAPPQLEGRAAFGGGDVLVIGTHGHTELPGRFFDELGGRRLRGFRVEVHVAADLAGAVDGGNRATHDIDRTGGADRRCIVARVLYPLETPEVVIRGIATQAQCPRDPEEGAGVGSRGEANQVVDIAQAVVFDQVGRHIRYRAWGLGDGFAQAENALHWLAGHDAHGVFDTLLENVVLKFDRLFLIFGHGLSAENLHSSRNCQGQFLRVTPVICTHGTLPYYICFYVKVVEQQASAYGQKHKLFLPYLHSLLEQVEVRYFFSEVISG